ncbi:MAG: shikimate dehydrogenase [Candidatus Omnitrophota bacterium]|nr:shikimate dehydrogenase [Candidatus Omnitrophota bacterium]
MTRAKRQIYGLIGYPVKHSLSPAMQTAAFKALGIDAEYKLFELEASRLRDFFAAIPENNIYGFNVTVPYKEKVAPFLDKISDQARLIGAVNTVKVSGAQKLGFNTDGEGFLRHLREGLQFDPQGKTIALIGAGGAAKAVAVYLAMAQAVQISVYDIDNNKLSALVDNLRSKFPAVKFKAASALSGLGIGDCHLLINATPVGMKEEDPCVVNEGFLHPGLLVYDLIYNPKETKLIKMARAAGAKTSNGLGMLLYQGMLSFEIWTGKKAPQEVMQSALGVP